MSEEDEKPVIGDEENTPSDADVVSTDGAAPKDYSSFVRQGKEQFSWRTIRIGRFPFRGPNGPDGT